MTSTKIETVMNAKNRKKEASTSGFPVSPLTIIVMLTPAVTYPPIVPDEQAIRRAAKLLNAAERPFIFVGGGAQGASKSVARLAERLDARVGATGNGLGVLPADDPRYVGTNATPGWWINRADVIIAIGTRFDTRTRWWIGTPKAKLIHLDLDPTVIGRTLSAEVSLVGDSAATLDILINQLDGPGISSWPEREKIAPGDVDDEQTVAILRTLRDSMDRDAALFNDMTLVCYQARRFFDVYAPRTFHSPITYGSLGFSVPAAIGAKIADRSRQVVALCGDGGFMFTAQEVLTAKQERLGLPIVLFNDNCYSAIRRSQDRDYEGRHVAVELDNPDFQLLAKSFGVASALVRRSDDLGNAVTDAFARDVPTIIEVDIERFK